MTKKEFKKLIQKGYIFVISGKQKDGMRATIEIGEDMHVRIHTGYPRYRLVKDFTCVGNYDEFMPNIITKEYLLYHVDKYLNIQYIDNEETTITYSKRHTIYFTLEGFDFPNTLE